MRKADTESIEEYVVLTRIAARLLAESEHVSRKARKLLHKANLEKHIADKAADEVALADA